LETYCLKKTQEIFGLYFAWNRNISSLYNDRSKTTRSSTTIQRSRRFIHDTNLRIFYFVSGTPVVLVMRYVPARSILRRVPYCSIANWRIWSCACCVGKVDDEGKRNLRWYAGMHYGHPAQLPAQLPARVPQSTFLRLDVLIGQLYSTGFQPARSPSQL
jgi:hypothetical protein